MLICNTRVAPNHTGSDITPPLPTTGGSQPLFTMEFTARGHRNVRATHRTTLEFVKEKWLTPRGECILGVNADFQKVSTASCCVTIVLDCAGHRDIIHGVFNPSWEAEALIIRKSGFADRNTFAILSDKAACDISRNIVSHMKNPGSLMRVVVRFKSTNK